MNRSKTLSDTRNLVLCAVCAAITCILAPLSIPLVGGIPLSLATFAVMLAGVLLGSGLGTVSQLIYLLLGAVGLPVFAGWTGGPGRLLGMTGGFLIGYIPLVWITGWIYKKFGTGAKMPVRILAMMAGMIVGNAALYALGTAWFMVMTGTPLQASLAACVIPFIPGDIIKMAAVCLVAPPVENAVRRTQRVGTAAV